MTIMASVTYGRIAIKISGEKREGVQEELLAFIDFLNENSDRVQIEGSPLPDSEEADSEQSGEASEDFADEHPLADTAKKLSVNSPELDDI